MGVNMFWSFTIRLFKNPLIPSVFRGPGIADPESVVSKVSETNACRNLDSPVEVLIDPDGWYSLFVHESRKEACP